MKSLDSTLSQPLVHSKCFPNSRHSLHSHRRRRSGNIRDRCWSTQQVCRANRSRRSTRCGSQRSICHRSWTTSSCSKGIDTFIILYLAYINISRCSSAFARILCASSRASDCQTLEVGPFATRCWRACPCATTTFIQVHPWSGSRFNGTLPAVLALSFAGRKEHPNKRQFPVPCLTCFQWV